MRGSSLVSNRVLEEFVGDLTAAEFCTRTGTRVEDLVRFCFEGRRAKGTGSRRATSSTGRKRQPAQERGSVNTRTQAGRDAFDASLLALLTGVQSGLSAREIAEETGASLPQIRSAIARLGKRVQSKGKTVARRYWAKG